METVKQILAEPACLGFCCGIAIGGTDNADINRLGDCGADALDLAALQKAQKLDLKIGMHFADFIEKQGAAVGHACGSAAIGNGSGEDSS